MCRLGEKCVDWEMCSVGEKCVDYRREMFGVGGLYFSAIVLIRNHLSMGSHSTRGVIRHRT